MKKTIYAWDLGATKCTAGLVQLTEDHSQITCQKNTTVKINEVDSLASLIATIEQRLDFAMSDADAVCIGAAGHFDGQRLTLENAYPFAMDFADNAKLHNWPNFAVIHDYAPVVCATFTSYMQSENNVKKLNNKDLHLYGRRVALGIGTGLGLKDGVLFANGDFWLGRNEVGHIGVTMPPLASDIHAKRHIELMKFLQEKMTGERQQAVTYEKILSGSGTVRLYQFFYSNDQNITPEEVGKKICEGKLNELIDALAFYAGLFVGTVQLTFMPEGGVWITGGVALKNLNIFLRPDFFAGIYASPSYRSQRDEYPLGVLCNHEHALVGCGYYAAKRLLPS